VTADHEKRSGRLPDLLGVLGPASLQTRNASEPAGVWAAVRARAKCVGEADQVHERQLPGVLAVREVVVHGAQGERMRHDRAAGPDGGERDDRGGNGAAGEAAGGCGLLAGEPADAAVEQAYPLGEADCVRKRRPLRLLPGREGEQRARQRERTIACRAVVRLDLGLARAGCRVTAGSSAAARARQPPA
jgi:hypothetical protein